MSSEGSGTDRALAAAFALLAGRDFSEAAMAQRLRRKGFESEEIEAAVARCRELGYLDDAAYARSRARARLERRPSGRRALLQDLRRQGLPRTMSEQAVDEVVDEAGGERAVLDRALHAWVARHGEPDDWRSAKRCADHLARRGFPAATVSDALAHWLDELGR